MVEEIITRYPSLDGIHLDYIRYPYPVPFVPNSQFNTHGLTYGYGEENLKRFEAASGLNPLTMSGESENYLAWDNWKREQLTSLVKEISNTLKTVSAKALLSCAVIHSPERAYSAAFQDWPLWLEEGIVNYVVIMNYTRDGRLAKAITTSALAHKGRGEIYVGIGSYLLANEPERFLAQFQDAKDLGADGVVFFSYDDISENEKAIIASEEW